MLFIVRFVLGIWKSLIVNKKPQTFLLMCLYNLNPKTLTSPSNNIFYLHDPSAQVGLY